MSLKLYTYFRSSASFRVRIALNLKGLDVEMVPIHLVRQGGQQLSEEFRRINPEALVPALVDEEDNGQQVLTQSLAIMEYLDEMYPEPPLLPAAPLDRAYVRSIALAIACDIHPLNNLRVLRYLVRDLKVSEEDKNAWYRHWCELGLAALEVKVSADGRAGKFCFGDTPTIADCCLVPQIFNARRLNCDLSGMPTLLRIAENCSQLDAFSKAEPGKQADAE
jgi:maleylpyruvate isomerase